MRFSVGLPTAMEGLMYPIPFANPQQVIEIAQLAEQLGYHSVWGNDHMTTPRYVRQEFSQPPNFWEALVTLSTVAAHTTTLRVGTGILVPAMRRDTVVLAKQLATLDQFSGGRLLLGVGVGAYREEFEALHPGWQVHRGRVLEENIHALRLLFSQRCASHQGEYLHFEDVEMYPKPLQDPLPLYVGGNNPNAVQRAARYGQGWLGAGMPLEQLREQIARLRRFALEYGRDPDKIDVAAQFSACLGSSFEVAKRKFRASQMYRHLVSLSATSLKDQVAAGFQFEDIDLVGSSQQIVERAGALGEAGMTHIAGILFTANTVEEYKQQMQVFAEEVMVHFPLHGN